MSKSLRILYLEDNPDDAEILKLTLAQEGLNCDLLVAETRSQYLTIIEEGNFDVILSDNNIPGFCGEAALEIAHEKFPQVPFVLISANNNEKEKNVYLENGARDYIRKDQLSKLSPIIQDVLVSNYHSLSDKKEEKTDNGISHTSPEKYTEAMERLMLVIQELSLARSMEEISAIVRIAARELTGADGATFVLKDGDQCYYVDENAIQPLWKGRRFPMSICIGGWCMRNRKQIIIEDVYDDERIPIEAYRPTFIKSLVMVPIRTESPIGAIGNYWASQHLATPEEVKLIQTLADTTSVAIENVQVYNELEQRVRDRTAQLEAANQELEAFSYTISHDLRSPLNSIIFFSGALLERNSEKLDQQGKNYLQRVNAAADRMNIQIDEVLALHQLTRADLKRESLDLSAIAQDVITHLQVLSSKSKRQVEVIIEEGLTAKGDYVLIRTVLENLLSNAWKYTSKREEAKIEFGLTTTPDGSEAFYVKDNGAGFDTTYSKKLFRPFQRMHSEAEFPGTGVGLASVQRIIQKHAGRIWVEAAVEEGATFYFTLPKVEQEIGGMSLINC